MSPIELENSATQTRRQFLATAAAVVGGASISLLMGANTSAYADSYNETKVKTGAANPSEQGLEIYLPNWMSAEQYQQLGEISGLQKVSRFVLAFSIPEGKGKLDTPPTSAGLSDFLKVVKPHSKIGLSVGGWGDSPQQHKAILAGWDKALHKPKAFAEQAANAVNEVGADYLDLDIEYPTPEQSPQVTRLVRNLRDKLPNDVRLSMAVPPYAQSDPSYSSLEFGHGGLQTMVDTFHIMSYDLNGPWSETAGYGAPGIWAINCINKWVERVGNPKQISVGYPTYGYVFAGAQQPGQKFTSASEVKYSEVPASAVHDDVAQLTSTAEVNQSWATLQSPNIIHATQAQILAKHPNIGGTFLWSAGDGLTPDHITALTD